MELDEIFQKKTEKLEQKKTLRRPKYTVAI
jgi:hypothetical protein